MRPLIQSLQAMTHTPEARVYGSIAGAVFVLSAAIWMVMRLRRPSVAEIERRRREHITGIGRTVSGTLTDARTLGGEDTSAPSPEILLYEYEVRGVAYRCGQDVSALAERVLGWRLDLPVSVRYDPANPGNSILVSEDWGGRWNRTQADRAKGSAPLAR